MREIPGTCTEYPRSGCGPGASIPEPTPNERISNAEYVRRVAQGLQMAADALMELAVRLERYERKPVDVESCEVCGKPTKVPFCIGGKRVCNQCAASDEIF